LVTPKISPAEHDFKGVYDKHEQRRNGKPCSKWLRSGTKICSRPCQEKHDAGKFQHIDHDYMTFSLVRQTLPPSGVLTLVLYLESVNDPDQELHNGEVSMPKIDMNF